MPFYSDADISSDVIINETRNYIDINPHSNMAPDTALLFYPGGLVDNHVYNEILADFTAASGIRSIVVNMPGNLAVLDIDAGLSVMEEFHEVNRWIIAGHSLGGSMAANLVYNNPSLFEGLIFMDSYPADGNSLEDWNGVVLSLFSSIEKVSDADRMERTFNLIPPATELTETDRVYPAETSNYSVWHWIDGGSHSYFGTYGPQDGDFTPTISREVFHAEVTDYMVEFFDENTWR